MIILYINNEHCLSVEQLKGYLKLALTPDNDIYKDLIDIGRQGDLAAWLREHDEIELASEIEEIPTALGDTDYFLSLKTILIGAEDIVIPDSNKPEFEDCFHVERITCERKSNDANICVFLKVKNSINEYFTVQIVSGWGTRGFSINSSDMATGEMLPLNFKLREIPGSDIGEIQLKIDDKISKNIEL